MEDSKVAGILVSVIQREYRGFLGQLTARSVIWGGPLACSNSNEIVSLLLREYNLKVRRQALFSQFRNLSDQNSFSGEFKQNGYIFVEHLNVVIDTGKDKDALWGGIHPTRRKQINRSQRRGVESVQDDPADNAILTRCYSILKNTYRSAGLPLPGIVYFINAVREFGKNNELKLFTARHESEIIGFRMVLCFKDVVYDWYAASSRDHLDKYPNDLLPWTILCWAKDNGFRKFDFGGAGKPGVEYGVRDYKVKFGGELVNFGRYMLVHRKLLYTVIITLFNIRRRIAGRK